MDNNFAEFWQYVVKTDSNIFWVDSFSQAHKIAVEQSKIAGYARIFAKTERPDGLAKEVRKYWRGQS